LEAVGSLDTAVRYSRAVVSAFQRAARESFNSRGEERRLVYTDKLKVIRALALFARPSRLLVKVSEEKASVSVAI
jgi:hypothetical protein